MGHVAVIFTWMCVFEIKTAHSSKNDRQSVPQTWSFKTEFSSPMQSFGYLLDVQGSKWPQVTACWSFDYFADFANPEIPKFSVWSYGSVCVVWIGMKTLQSVELYIRITKIYTCWGRTRHHDELARFGHRWVIFSVNRQSLGFFSVLVNYTSNPPKVNNKVALTHR